MIRHLSLTSILLAACAAHTPTTPGPDELAGENGQDGEAPKADDPYNNFGLYEARKIGAFECNGAGTCTHIEFDRANRSTMTCADGTSHATCTARTFDMSSLPLSASKLDAVTNALQRQAEDPSLDTQVLVRGVFVHGTNPTQDGDWVTFAPTEIWLAQKAYGTTDGTFVRLNDNNIRCITSPCPTIHEGRLNSSRGMDIDGIDFGDDDALQDAVDGALSTTDGVIVVGNRTYGEQGSSDKLRTTNQVYLRVK
jgi:hypothetical protein